MFSKDQLKHGLFLEQSIQTTRFWAAVPVKLDKWISDHLQSQRFTRNHEMDVLEKTGILLPLSL